MLMFRVPTSYSFVTFVQCAKLAVRIMYKNAWILVLLKNSQQEVGDQEPD